MSSLLSGQGRNRRRTPGGHGGRVPPRLAPAIAGLLALAAMVGVLAACGAPARATVRFDGGTVHARVADTLEERTRGLQGEPDIAPGQGMLFVWPDEAPRSFRLGDVGYPLDVILMAEDGTVTDVLELDPDGSRFASSAASSRYGLEVPGGWARANEVEPGQTARVDLRP